MKLSERLLMMHESVAWRRIRPGRYELVIDGKPAGKFVTQIEEGPNSGKWNTGISEPCDTLKQAKETLLGEKR
jgi:hypothetical protein